MMIIYLLFIISPAAGAETRVQASAPRLAPVTMKQAREWCDTTALHSLEGLYFFPAQGSVVLVKARDRNPLVPPAEYIIVNIESRNILISPGQVTGYLYPTGDPMRFRLTLYTRATDAGLKRPKNFAVKYQPQQATLTYEKPSTRFTFNPLALLPGLTRLLRLTHTDPAKNLAEGLVRIYPVNTASPLSAPLLPRYF